LTKKLLLTVITSNLLSANIADIQSIESNFTQSVTNEQNAKVTYKGKLYAVKKSNLALWKYTSPVVKKIYYKGNGKLTIIEPELEQVIFAKLHKVPNILKLIESAQKNKNGNLQTEYNGIKYIIKIKDQKIASVSYKDDMQNRVVINFSNEKLNKEIDKRVFSYNIPKEYDIIEQ
jgi:outer membrane lipoprotein carrier protein